MKLIIKSLLVVFLFGINQKSFGQNKIAKKAINSGKNVELVYIANARSNSFITPRNLEHWERKNALKYFILNKEIYSFWFAGCKRDLVTKFSFIEKKDFEKYKAIQAENERQRLLAKEERRKVDMAVGATGLAVFGAIIGSAAKGIKEHVNNYGKYDTPASSSSSGSSTSSASSNKTNDYKSIELPDYKMDDWKDSENLVTGSKWSYNFIFFKDGEKGYVYKDRLRREKPYYLEDWTGTKIESYETLDQAIRALYIYKKYDAVIEY